MHAYENMMRFVHTYENNEICFHASSTHTSVSVITFIKEISDFKRSPSNLRKHIKVAKFFPFSLSDPISVIPVIKHTNNQYSYRNINIEQSNILNLRGHKQAELK